MADRMSLPPGYERRHFPEIDSTNEEAKRCAERGEPGPIWITADHQTAGRGRRGRTWVSPKGNLMTTLFLRPECSPAKAAELSFVAGLALRDAVVHCAPSHQAEIALKWPNDLLIGGKKIAGMLLESAVSGPGNVAWLAIGIGLNLNAFPTETPYPATSLLAATGVAPPVDMALSLLAAAFDKRLSLWRQEGFAPVREEWLTHAAGRGRPITVRLSNETIDGVFETLEPDGALRLKLADGGDRLISTGDVFFPSPKE